MTIYTFLFAVNLHGRPVAPLLRAAASAARPLALPGGEGLESACVLLPELKGGWIQVTPSEERPQALYSGFVDDRRAVLVWGDVDRATDQSAARLIAATWRARGLAAVRRLEGCFAAILVDRARKEVLLVSDLTGRRSLRWAQHEGALLVSPHDLLIAASGACPVAFDLEAAACAMAYEWSLQAGSFLRPIRACRPTGYVRWAGGRADEVSAPLLDFQERLAVDDTAACAAEVDRVIDTMRARARRFVAVPGEIEADLTAGLDTRAMVGVLLSVTDRSRLHLMTRGAPGSDEVRTARRLAEACGMRFSSREPEQPSPGEFLRHCDLLAFHMNGDTSGKRAVDRLPRYEPRPVPHAVGTSGAVFRGYPYETLPIAACGPLPLDRAVGILQERLRRKCLALPWADPVRVADGLQARLRRAVDAYAPIASDGCDLLDLFYLYERVGVWGSLCARLPWLRTQWSPFESVRAIRRFTRIPPALRMENLVHAELVRRYLPQGYWMRVNGEPAPALYGYGASRRRLRALDRRRRAVTGRLGRVLAGLRSGRAPRMVDQARSEMLAGPLGGVVRDTLMEEDSVSRALLGPDGTARLIEAHAGGRGDHLSALTTLVVLERWRLLAREAVGMSVSTANAQEAWA